MYCNQLQMTFLTHVEVAGRQSNTPDKYLCRVSALSTRVHALLARMRTSANGSEKSLCVLSPNAGPCLQGRRANESVETP